MYTDMCTEMCTGTENTFYLHRCHIGPRRRRQSAPSARARARSAVFALVSENMLVREHIIVQVKGNTKHYAVRACDGTSNPSVTTLCMMRRGQWF